jgi:hypothetical protein
VERAKGATAYINYAITGFQADPTASIPDLVRMYPVVAHVK